jgi:hypothetical protein
MAVFGDHTTYVETGEQGVAGVLHLLVMWMADINSH